MKDCDGSNGERWLMNAEGAATYLGISPRNLWELTQQESIPYLKIGRRVLYAPEELRAWAYRKMRGERGS
jgi:excisionase family DNA binding protein